MYTSQVISTATPYGHIPSWLFMVDDKLFRLYCSLAVHDGKRGCFPSHARLAVLNHCSTRTIKRRLGILKNLGLVDWENTPGANRYELRQPNSTIEIEGYLQKKGWNSEEIAELVSGVVVKHKTVVYAVRKEA
jgi:hypothetical protein